MNIFDQLKDIIDTKAGRYLSECEGDSDFGTFMTQKWISFYSPSFANRLNNTVNAQWMIPLSKAQWYMYFTAVLPKSKYKMIRYIKKNKTTTGSTRVKTDADVIKYLSVCYELSEREVREYISTGCVDMKALKKQLDGN